MSQAHMHESESEAADRRFIIQSVDESGAIELVRNQMRRGHGSNYTENDHSKKNFQAV